MKKKKPDPIRRLRVRKGATLKEIYAAARKQFTADDLQKFTEIGCVPMVAADTLLADLDAIHHEESAKLAKKRKRKSSAPRV